MNGALFIAFTLFSLWDFYYPGAGRVLDYTGLSILITAALGRFLAGGRLPSFRVAYLILILLLTPMLLVGLAGNALLPVAAFLTGALVVYAIFEAIPIDAHVLHRQIGFLLVVNLAFFFFQFALYHVSGVVADFHTWSGGLRPRTFNQDLKYFRPAGLYQEPNSFSITLFMLNTLRLVESRSKFDLLFALSLVAMMLSTSLWGLGALLLLVGIRSGSLRLARGRLTVALVLLSAGLWTLFNSRPQLGAILQLFDPRTAARLASVQRDPSVQARYGGWSQLTVDREFVLGHGISTSYFQSFLGANGISFFLYSFGLLGLLAFLIWLRAEFGQRAIRGILVVLFAMSTYPMFTYAFWWAWLALFIREIELLVEEPAVGERINRVLRRASKTYPRESIAT